MEFHITRSERGRAGKGPARLAPRRPADPTRTVRDQFPVEIGDGSGTRDLAELNRLFSASIQAAYHRSVHSETGQPPAARWARGIPDPLPLSAPAQLREAFLWSERRTVKRRPPCPYDVLGALSLAASRLGQTFTQITRCLTCAAAVGQRGHDFGEDSVLAADAALSSSATRLLAPPPWSATSTLPSSSSPRQRAPPPDPAGRTSHDHLTRYRGTHCTRYAFLMWFFAVQLYEPIPRAGRNPYPVSPYKRGIARSNPVATTRYLHGSRLIHWAVEMDSLAKLP